MAVTDHPVGRPGLRAPGARSGPRDGARGGKAAPARDDTALIGKLPLPAALYLVTVMLPIMFNVGPLAMSLQRAYLLAMTLPLTFQLLAGRGGRLIWTDFLFFAYIGWMSVAVAVNNPEMVIQNTGSAAIEFLGGYLVGRLYIRSRADFIALCRWLGILVALTLPLALVESQTGNAPLLTAINALPGVHSISNFYIEPRMGLQRSQVFLPHPIHYGLFCSTAFALTVVALKGVIPDGRRWLLGAAVGLGVFLSLSSGALLPMVLQIGLILWLAMFHRLSRPWLVLAVLFAIAYAIVEVLSNRTALMVFLSYATFSTHNAYWRAQIFEWGMVNVWANPIFGLGFRDWVRPHYMNSGSMDNFWLVQAVRYGIPGFLLIATGYGIGLLRVGMRDFTADPVLAQLRRAWIYTFIGLTLTLCTVHVWTVMYSFTFFMFGAGMWFLSAEPEARAEPEDPRHRPAAPRRSVERVAPPPTDAAPEAEPRARSPYTRFPIHPKT